MTSRDFVLAHSNGVCCYCGGVATQIEHTVPSAMRRRYHIKHTDQRYWVSACAPCNLRKLTRRYYAKGFDVSLLPGKGWQCWQGGPHLEVKK